MNINTSYGKGVMRQLDTNKKKLAVILVATLASAGLIWGGLYLRQQVASDSQYQYQKTALDNLLLEAQELAVQGEYDTALAKIDAAVAGYKKDKEALFSLYTVKGYVCAQKGDTDCALESYLLASKTKEDFNSLTNVAVQAKAVGNHALAKEYYQRALEYAEQYPGVYDDETRESLKTKISEL